LDEVTISARFEAARAWVMAFAREAKRPRRPSCFISYAWGEADREHWVENRLARALQDAGIEVILDRWHNARVGAPVHRFISLIEKAQYVIVVGTPLYRRKYENKLSKTGSVVAAEVDLINLRLVGTERQKNTVLPVLLDGNERRSLPPLVRGRKFADFRCPQAYYATLFDLIVTLYGLPFEDPVVGSLREALRPCNATVEELGPTCKSEAEACGAGRSV
jgi:hypothetical protein